MAAKHKLPFNGIFDLFSKAEKIKMAHELVNSLYKKHLLDNAIQFTEMVDYGVMIDIGKVPDEKKELIENPFKGIIETVYAQTGVENN
jgi:hypothetical protein